MLQGVMNYLTHLLVMIENQDWNKLEEIAISNAKTFRILSKSISECEEFNGMSLLHACVRFNPPITVLDKMIRLYPKALSEEDCLGRTPLHVAAGSGASALVIKHLTANYPQACNVQDEDGRTPLHFACDVTCEMFEDDQGSPRDPPSLDTVRILLSGSLTSVTLEDVDEMNAVEYAIISDAPIEVVNLLQRASQRMRKKRQTKTETKTKTNSPKGSMSRISVN